MHLSLALLPQAAAIARVSDGSLLNVNDACTELFGQQRADLIGRELPGLAIWHLAEDRQRLSEALHCSTRAAGVELCARVPAGALRYLLLATAPAVIDGVNCAICSFTDITAQKLTELELRDAGQRFGQMADTIREVFWMFDNQQSKGVYISPAFTTIWGLAPQRFYDDPRCYIDSIHPDDRQVMFGALERQARGEATDMEYRIIRPDGGVRWIHDRSFPVFDDRGDLLRTVGIAADITERKLAELALRASEDRYRGLLKSIDTIVIAIGLDGRVIYVNDVAVERFGKPADDLIGKTLAELFPNEPAAARLEHMRAVIATDCGTTYEVQYRLQGEYRWYRTTLQPIHDASGAMVYVLANATDIHDLKTMQQELLELNHTLEERVKLRADEVRDLYEHAPIGYQSLDANGHITLINETESRWLGYAHEELIGRPFVEFVTPQTRAAFLDGFAALKRDGSITNLDCELVRKDGSSFPAMLTAIVVRDAEGAVSSARFTVFDNTERVRTETALLLTNAHLERALQAKDEFLANMSHELRTPLNAILALSEAMIEQVRGPLNPRQLRAMEHISASGQHLLALITDILDLSKIEAGGLHIEREPVAVQEICDASLSLVRAQADSKQIQLAYQMNNERAVALVDPKRLKQILVNLLSNAVKFTPSGGAVGLSVTADAAAHTISFEVFDTGIGISPRDIPRLFQPFTQLDSGLSRQFEGSGLGLALARRLVELHDGSINVASDIGRGSRFTIVLPYDATVTRSFRPAVAGADRSAALAHDAALKILIAEDNDVNIGAIGDYLRDRGYQIVVARNGREALALVAETRPDVILMDIQMPEMDGIEAMRRLRALPEFRATPIIALTALAMPGDRERCLAAGANEYLSKPVSLHDLLETIARLRLRAPSI